MTKEELIQQAVEGKKNIFRYRPSKIQITNVHIYNSLNDLKEGMSLLMQYISTKEELERRFRNKKRRERRKEKKV